MVTQGFPQCLQCRLSFFVEPARIQAVTRRVHEEKRERQRCAYMYMHIHIHIHIHMHMHMHIHILYAYVYVYVYCVYASTLFK